jgi:hypothetical protein
MTFREWVVNYCFDKGMFGTQASAVVADMVAADRTNEAMTGRWNDDVSGYSEALLALLMPSIDKNALVYIEKTCPDVWYKPMFDGTFDGTADKLG